MRSRRMARYVLTGLALAFLGLLPPAGQTDGLLSPSEPAEEVDEQLPPSEKAGGPLRFRLQEGDLFAYQIKMKMDMTINIKGQDITSGQEMTMVVEQRTIEVEPETGYGVIQTTIKAMNATLTMKNLPPGITQAQADAHMKQSEALMNRMTKPMLNKPYKMTMTPRGEIKKIDAKPLKEAVNSMIATLGPEVSAPLADMFSEETLKKNSAAAGIIYPKEDEAKWTKEGEISMGLIGELHLKEVWERQEDETVLKIPSHKLTLSATGKMADPNASRQLQGVLFTANLSGFEMEGTVHVSQEDGWPVKTKMLSSVVMSMAVEEGCSVEGANFKVKQTMTAKRLTPEKYKQLFGSEEGGEEGNNNGGTQ